ncbi:glycosyltransferase family 9 protein [Paraburkholderia sp.]|uniref:glycosyltransferase family 9 protein n=1 Tax=Paraburkholderia sp. TaxID=1926495 RepID=UPI002386D2A0|nr:glycosyltransferase family 9 protein [Paraburkholderia sp.]MDE1179040.1 glycosyltransferase family 9 protein [Paraburkholderia sp.]
MSPALGDTLILLVVAHNLRRAGWKVHVFGDHAWSLAEWFAHLEISPALKAEEAEAALAPYAVVLQLHRDRPLANLAEKHSGFIDLHDVEYANSTQCMAQRCADFVGSHFGLRDVVVSNGIKAPTHLRFRRHHARVAMHPEASTDDKRWLANRFIQLSRRLTSKGMSAEFAIAPGERGRWDGLRRETPPLCSFTSTAALAEWLYESGWFIGNDSGVGHLASSLGVPTLTVFRRRRIAERWRPGFAAGSVVLPPWWLPTAKLKERFWRESITVRRVFASFEALRSNAPSRR